MIGFDDVIELMAVSSAVTSIGAAAVALFQRGLSAQKSVEIRIDGKTVDLKVANQSDVDEMIAKIRNQLVEDLPASKSAVSRSDVAG